MKKQFTLLILLLLWAGSSWAQVSRYTFASSTGTYTPLATETILWSGTFDDNNSAAITIPTFTADGVPYTTMFVQANGWITLGGTSISSSYTPISNSTSYPVVISVFGRDLENADVGTPKISYNVNDGGDIVVQWQDVHRYSSSTDAERISFQIRLVPTTGLIKFIYGGTIVAGTSTSTMQIGLRGLTNTIFTNRTTTTDWTATTKGTLNTDACSWTPTVMPPVGLTYVYSPPPPCVTPTAQPTALLLTPALTSIAGTFTAASGADDYLVVRSLNASLTANPVNGTTYPVGSSLGGGTVDYYGTGTAFTSSGLSVNTLYHYFVFSANDASCSGGPLYLTTSPLTGSTTTLAPGSITSAADGPWSATTTWTGGVVPTASDNVIINHNVNVDAATCTCFDLTINATKTLACTGTTGVLTVAGNLTNNGTLDFYVDASNYAGLTFTSATSNTFTSPASKGATDLNALTINKGTSFSYYLDMNLSALTIKGLNTAAVGFLTLTNGTLKISGNYAFDGKVFTTTGYSIPASAGFWLNNPNFTVIGQTGSPSVAGLLRITNGTLNVGTAAGNSMTFSSGCTIFIEGGAINTAGRFAVSTSTNVVNYTQIGGVVTVCTVGNTSSTYASFDLGTATTSAASLVGGSIVVQLASTATSGPRDFRGLSTGATPYDYTGTTLYLGNASTPATAQTYYLGGRVPPMVITTTTATHKIALNAAVYYHGNLTIPTGSDLNLNGYGFWCKGNVVNDGTITGTTASSRFDFAGQLFGDTPAAQTYTGTGYFGPSATLTTNMSLGINNSNGVTLNGPVNAYRVNLFCGAVTNSGNITIGNGAALASYVQIGVNGNTRTGGSFDAAPVFNLGTGTYTVLYEPEIAARTTGFEIPGTRTITNLSINNTNGVTLNGGTLNLDAAGVLTMTTGLLNTSATNLLVLNNTGTAISGGSSTSFVNGPLSRTFAASRVAAGTFTTATLFPIGKGTTYLPLWVDPTTTADGPVVFKGEAFTSNSGTMGPGVTYLSQDRWEAPVTSGNANLTSTFLGIGDAAIVSGNQILKANTAAGAYGAIPSVSTFTEGTPNTLFTTGAQIPAASYAGFFAYGTLTSCPLPTAQPTNFSAQYIYATGFDGSFTPASPAPSNYLVVRYPGGSEVTPPADYTSYTVGGALGLGTVRSISNANTFTETGLTAGSTYDYYVYSYNNLGCYGPVYLTTAPLVAHVFTCAEAIGVPGTPTSSSITATGFTANWTASSTEGAVYLLDVSTASDFSSYVPGYEHNNVGSVLSFPITGLANSTVYYTRVRAYVTGVCFSAYSGTLTTTTRCPAVTTFPYTESFGPTFSCWSAEEAVTGASRHWAPTTADGTYGVSGPQSGTHFAYLYVYLASSTYNPYYLVSPDFQLGATPRQISYYYYLGASGYTTTPVPLTLQISTDNGGTWTDLYAHTTANSTFGTSNALTWWTQNTVTLGAYVNQTVRFRFAANSNYGSGFCDQGLDEIVIGDAPACIPPTGLTVNNLHPTSANLTWTPGGSETSWEYAYGLNPLAVPTTPGTATTSATTNPIGGLTANTAYDFYVRSNCGGTFSSWAGPYTFTTPCNAASLPYQEHFDLATFPACWTQTSTLSDRWTVSSTTSAGGTANEMKASYVSGTGISRLISPPINTTGVAQIGLSFKHYFNTYGEGINYKIQSSSDGVTWTDEAWGGASGTVDVGPETVNTTVTHNLGGTTYIAWVLDGNHFQFDYWYVDDVSIISLEAGTLQGHVYDPSGEEVIDNATVSFSTFSTTTDINGFYQFLNVPVGTYDVTCSKTGYITGTATGVIVNLNQTTTRNFNLQYQLDPPHGLRAEIQGADNVHLTWQAPADNQYIHWDDGTTAHNIGSSAASSFEAIVRFPVADLNQFDGMYLSAIRFYASSYVANAWELMIYQGENPPTLIYSQPIDAVNAGAWNEINLTTPLQIDGTQELWFGYFVDYNAAMYPAGTDAGPAVAGMNWIYDGATWSLMEDLPLNYNWNIQGWVTNTSGAKMLLSSGQVQQPVVQKQFQGNTRELTAIPFNNADLSNAMKAPKAPNAWTPNGYNIYRDGVKLNTSGWVTNLYYDDLGLAPDTYLYTVKAVYPMGESPQAAGPVEVTILSCPMPTQLGTSEIGTDHAILVWTSQETLFNIEWGPTGFTPGTGTMINGVTSPHTLNSLVANTSYDFYVQTDCGTEESPFAGPHTFTTLCGVAETPFTEDFEGNLFFPACWSGTTTSPRWQRSIDCSGYGIGTASAIANFYSISSSNPFDLITFEFDASGLNSPQLKFDYAYATYTTEAFDQMDVYTSTDAGATWNLLLAMPGGETGILNTGGAVSGSFVPLETEWATQTLPLPEGTNMIKFTATSDYGNNLYLDNVIVQATPVPENLTVQNETVSGENCYNATQTITVAGGETTFLVEATGSATFIAGQNILFLPGTKVLAGGYLHGYIAPTGPFCGEAANTMVTKTVEAIEETPAIQSGEFFTVYPNPTNDKFYLELDPSYRDANIIVNIYGMVGGLVQKEQLTGNNRYEFSLSGKNTGVYFIRVMAGDRIDTKKVIKK